ncbi:MAG: tetratricopeptide repeat protein [Endozoicomonadaceae bacterium]|nr:tetratricopeptide repeat protein [Endozoicomonadaceae bacterium]
MISFFFKLNQLIVIMFLSMVIPVTCHALKWDHFLPGDSNILKKKQVNKTVEPGVNDKLYIELEQMKSEINDLKQAILNLQHFITSSLGRYHIKTNKQDHHIFLSDEKKLPGLQPASDTQPASSIKFQNSDDQTAYNNILKLITDKQYDLAIERLQRFIILYKNSLNHIAARQYLAELYIEKQELGQAKNIFVNLIQSCAMHAKIPHWLFKLAEISQKDKEIEIAKMYYIELIKKYPHHAAARLAETQLKIIQTDERIKKNT